MIRRHLDRRSLHLFHPLFDRRAGKPIVLPLIAAVLALLLYARDGRTETVKGMDGKGRAYVCELRPPYPLLEFCVKFDLPNVPNPRGWR